jgi:NAD(P)-dependent dehydrogenase (short-subunit alcohol dehydrogenase family)
MSYWRGKSAIVTGAASGIGLALSKALVEKCVNVWITDIDYEGLEKAASDLGTSARPVQLDVRDPGRFRELVDLVVKEEGRLDFLFNNAGILISGEARDFDTVRFDRIIDVNIRGVVNGTMAAYSVMIRQGAGHIVNTASLGGLMPSPLMAAYGMSKHAVVGLTPDWQGSRALRISSQARPSGGSKRTGP